MFKKKREAMELRFTNSLQEPRILIVEPWAGEYTIAPGKSLDLLAEGRQPYKFEVELSEDRVTFYALGDIDDARIFRDGAEVKSE